MSSNGQINLTALVLRSRRHFSTTIDFKADIHVTPHTMRNSSQHTRTLLALLLDHAPD
jgi:hypothetical protein